MEAGKYTSMFADSGSYSRETLYKTDESSHVDWLKNTMKDEVFDFVRETEAFRSIGEA